MTIADQVAQIQAETKANAREKLLRRYRAEIFVESPDPARIAKLAADLNFDAATVGRHLAAVREGRRLEAATGGWSEAQYLETLQALNVRHHELEAAKLENERALDDSRQKLGNATQSRQFYGDKLRALSSLKNSLPEIFEVV